MLLSLLFIIAFSVITLQYLRRHAALLEVSRVKAEYAAQSGIAIVSGDKEIMARLTSGNESGVTTYQLSDGSKADVNAEFWGVFVRARSTGRHKALQAVRSALLARRLSPRFAPALVFGGLDHQLILSGNISIIGDVETGVSGVATGSLPGYRTPRVVPVAGAVRSNGGATYVGYDQTMIMKLRKDLEAVLAARPIAQDLCSMGGQAVCVNAIPDTVDFISLGGGARLQGTASRSATPLTLAVDGACTLTHSVALIGFTKVIATGLIVVERGATVDGAVLMSSRKIILEQSASVRAQMIAPCVELDTLSSARYPSLAVALSFAPNSTVRPSVLIRDRATLEGFAGVAENGIMQVERNASVVGILHSAGTMTEDGVIAGCVMTRNFSFYLAPTEYRGWLRDGTINRRALPSGALLPIVLDDPTPLGVVQWW